MTPKPRAPKARLWTTSVAALWAVLALTGCDLDVTNGDPPGCMTASIYGVNPTTGACEIVPGCVISTPTGLVFPEGWRVCGDIPPGDCDGLDERACASAPNCQPHYTRPVSSAPSADSGADRDPSAPYPGVPYPGDPEPSPLPPTEPGYLYVGCYAAVNPCANLDEQACIDARGCEPQYSALPCDCAGTPASGAPDQDERMPAPLLPPDCLCVDIEQYSGCAQATTPPPARCAEHGEVRACVGAGCEWVDHGGRDIAPCVCEGDSDRCDCGAFMPEPVGYCRDPLPPPRDCYSLYDAYSCISTRGCEWVGELGGGEPPPDERCACEDSDVSCGCGMPAPIGYCQPVTPTGCWSYGDPYACSSDPACAWVNPDGTIDDSDPGFMPCDCPPDDRGCACTAPAPMPEPWGYCIDRPWGCASYGDEWSCLRDPSCGWRSEGDGGGDFAPCACDPSWPDDCACDAPMPPMPGGYCYDVWTPDPCSGYWDARACTSDPACAWADYRDDDDRPAPDFCPPDMPGCGGAPDPCWGAWVDERDTCRGPADQVLPAECCAAQEPPSGYCYTQPVDSCASLPDAWSCRSKAGCTWTSLDPRPIPPLCEDESDPNCAPDGCEGAALDASGECMLPNGERAYPGCCGAAAAGFCHADAP